MTTPLDIDPIRDPQDLPALYSSANAQSIEAQNTFLRALSVRMISLLVATVGGAVSFVVWDLRVAAFVAAIAFLVALAVELYSAIARPDREWYEGRAAAESAKTIAWRYMVRGENFDAEDDTSADKLLHQELKDILQDLGSVDIDLSAPGGSQQITPVMRTVRASDFDVRKAIYRRDRIVDQQGWYARKAKWNRRRSRGWIVGAIVAEFVGVVAAAVVVFGLLEGIDLLGIFAALAATITAWSQAKQYQNLATAYGVTTQELASVLDELDALSDETKWSAFVGQAEEAISREHTLWRASRGIRVKRGHAR